MTMLLTIPNAALLLVVASLIVTCFAAAGRAPLWVAVLLVTLALLVR